VRLPARVLRLIERDELRISPVVLLEMQLLQEIGRLNIGPEQWMEILSRDFDVKLCPLPLHRVITESLKLSWTRDPFDRMIVAQAIAGQGKLITRDDRMHTNFNGAIW
jgi:PIN domain nuclease of toxin-antitoxin system